MRPDAVPLHPAPLLALGWLLGAGILLACSSVVNTATSHLLGPEIGPCAGAMDSVLKRRGTPTRKEYHDSEDLDTKKQDVEHHWYYTAVADSAVVVQFLWDNSGDHCVVREVPIRSAKPDSTAQARPPD